jgi:hypothetical protein
MYSSRLVIPSYSASTHCHYLQTILLEEAENFYNLLVDQFEVVNYNVTEELAAGALPPAYY